MSHKPSGHPSQHHHIITMVKERVQHIFHSGSDVQTMLSLCIRVIYVIHPSIQIPDPEKSKSDLASSTEHRGPPAEGGPKNAYKCTKDKATISTEESSFPIEPGRNTHILRTRHAMTCPVCNDAFALLFGPMHCSPACVLLSGLSCPVNPFPTGAKPLHA